MPSHAATQPANAAAEVLEQKIPKVDSRYAGFAAGVLSGWTKVSFCMTRAQVSELTVSSSAHRRSANRYDQDKITMRPSRNISRRCLGVLHEDHIQGGTKSTLQGSQCASSGMEHHRWHPHGIVSCNGTSTLLSVVLNRFRRLNNYRSFLLANGFEEPIPAGLERLSKAEDNTGKRLSLLGHCIAGESEAADR